MRAALDFLHKWKKMSSVEHETVGASAVDLRCDFVQRTGDRRRAKRPGQGLPDRFGHAHACMCAARISGMFVEKIQEVLEKGIDHNALATIQLFERPSRPTNHTDAV